MNFTESKARIRNPDQIRHLYVHIPFCPKICPYCSFYKEASDRNKTQAFLDAVLLELDRFRPERLAGETIFFGGGTPSALSVKQLEYLLEGLHERLDLSNLKEWTFEMNPATVSIEKARMLQDFGVNRISMGVQSWDPEILARLGRVHSAEQARKSYDTLRQAGFENINLDFIFGVPGQSPESWRNTLAEAMRLAPDHLSTYCLTYEEDTEFFRRLQAGEWSIDEERDAEYYRVSMEVLEAGGYQQYEISNYSRPGYECRHNLAYWLGYDYLGLGPSAFSTISTERWQNIPDTSRYIEAVVQNGETAKFREEVSPATRRAEVLAFSLRTNRGVAIDDLREWEPQVEALQAEGYLEATERHLRLTPKGRMVADSIAELFV